ncbi:UNVERIFIED_CONTAM: hypothetical protein Sradi_5802200 [Sesamum radiatum]|uniref:Uncharacterized protein n=1 Tax=Sesamum radiatum TaxID=300843 RepID=A0AAW2KPH8_SESRA
MNNVCVTKEKQQAKDVQGQPVVVNEVESEGTVHGLEQIQLVPYTFQGTKFDTHMQVENLATRNNALELGLVQIPLRFVTQGPMEPRTRGRRGRRGSVTSVVGSGRKQCRGISLIEPNPEGVQASKRRTMTNDEIYCLPSAEATEQSHQLP